MCNDFVPSCTSLNMQVKEKKIKTTSFFHEEKSFPPRAEASSLCFVSWRGRHIIQELGTHFQKGEKTDRVDSPLRKEVLHVSNVGDTR